MAAPGQAIKRLNHTHEAIALWLICNPDKPLSECARHFGYTQPWLSQVIHSNMFQVLYRRLAEEMQGSVIHTLHDEMTALASEVVEASREKLRIGASEDFIKDTTKNILGALGYAPRFSQTVQSGPSQHVHFHTVTKEDIEAAREAARQRFRQPEAGASQVLDAVPAEVSVACVPTPASAAEQLLGLD